MERIFSLAQIPAQQKNLTGPILTGVIFKLKANFIFYILAFFLKDFFGKLMQIAYLRFL